MPSQEAQTPARTSFEPTLDENGLVRKSGLLNDLRRVVKELRVTEIKRAEAVNHLQECVDVTAEN